MVVEDERIEREAMIKLLQSENNSKIKVISDVSSGEEAIELIKTIKPDLIFMDIQMQGLNGLDASALIKKIRPETQIIIVTAYSEFEYAKKALQIGIIDYLVKPYSRKTLSALLDKHIPFLEQNKENKNISTENTLIENAVIYISENYMKDIKLEDISRAVGLSKYHFSRLFKEEMNKTYIEYLTEYRVNKARILFENTDKSVKEVSYEVGYLEPNYFTKIFKKITEKSPSYYKKHLDKK